MNNDSSAVFLSHLFRNHMVEVADSVVFSDAAETVMRHMERSELDSLTEAVKRDDIDIPRDQERRERFRDAVMSHVAGAKEHSIPSPHVVLHGEASEWDTDLPQAQALAQQLGVAVALMPGDVDEVLCPVATPDEVTWVKVTDEIVYGTLNVSLDNACAVVEDQIEPRGHAVWLRDTSYLPKASRELAAMTMPLDRQTDLARELARDGMAIKSADDDGWRPMPVMDVYYRVEDRRKRHERYIASVKQKLARESDLAR